MYGEIQHLTSAGKLLRFTNPPGFYPVNAYQSLVLATASEIAAHMLAARSRRKFNEMSAWEPCCGGGPAAITLKSLGFGVVQASDIDAEAVALCRANAERNQVFLDRTTCGDILEDGNSTPFDLICCNPPCGVAAAVESSPPGRIKRAVDGGERGMHQTLALLKQAPKRLTRDGSLVFVAVSTGAVTSLLQALDEYFPGRWRTLPATPVAAPWAREDDQRAAKLLSGFQSFQPFIWRRGDGWVWRLTWVIEASMEVCAPVVKGLPLYPYGYETAADPALLAQIVKFGHDGYWLTSP